ncbi:40S ribosomal protein S5-1 [Hordeum vulgare]|nr:40S ribosomal protein S5-1 [Hordeum vulgare]
MREGMLHIRDVEGPKKTRSMETRLEAMEQQVFKCQGMVERGLNANHMMITEFTNKHRIDANDIGKHLSRLYERIDQLQGQIYDLQNQNCSDDNQNNFSEPHDESDSSTSPERTPFNLGTPSSHGMPKASTRSRKKLISDEEDSDFVPEVPPHQK